MKNIQNWEKFNESYNQEMINEGLIGDIIKLPFKILGFLLKPLVPLLLKVIGKTISIENKWKVIKAVLDNVVKLALDIEEAKKKLDKEGSDLTPNERRELEKKVEKFKKEYPNGFKFSVEKKKLVESVEKNFAKATDEKKKEDLEWILKKISDYKASKPIGQYNIEMLDDLIVESIKNNLKK
jgi:dsDNA-specific endonuclease/ATPase MutS2